MEVGRLEALQEGALCLLPGQWRGSRAEGGSSTLSPRKVSASPNGRTERKDLSRSPAKRPWESAVQSPVSTLKLVHSRVLIG